MGEGVFLYYKMPSLVCIAILDSKKSKRRRKDAEKKGNISLNISMPPLPHSSS